MGLSFVAKTNQIAREQKPALIGLVEQPDGKGWKMDVIGREAKRRQPLIKAEWTLSALVLERLGGSSHEIRDSKQPRYM